MPLFPPASGGSIPKAWEVHNTVMALHASTEKYRTFNDFPVDSLWTDSGGFTQVTYATGVVLVSSTAAKYYLPVLGGGAPTGGGPIAQWNAGKNFCATIGISFDEDDGSGSPCGFGFSTANIDWDSGAATNKRIGIAVRSGTVKGVTADGTTLAETADIDGDFTARTLHHWTIFIKDSNDTAYFYLDGVLKGTLSTNTLLNNTGDMYWNFSVGGSNTDFAIGEFITSYQI